MLTGKIAAFVAKSLFFSNHPHGTFYLEDLFPLNDINNLQLPKIKYNKK